MKWQKILSSANAGFWLFISLVFFGSMIWAKSRDPFERIWFTLKTPHYGKVKGVAVLPVGVGQSFQPAGEKGAIYEDFKGGRQDALSYVKNDRQDALPYVFYIYGSGGSLINSGNELRQLAELGMAAIAIEYNQTNQAAFEEQFVAARKWTASNAERGTRNSERGTRKRENGTRNVCHMAGLNSALNTLNESSRQRLFRLAVWDAHSLTSGSEAYAVAPIRLMYATYNSLSQPPAGINLPLLSSEQSFQLDIGHLPSELIPTVSSVKDELGLNSRP